MTDQLISGSLAMVLATLEMFATQHSTNPHGLSKRTKAKKNTTVNATSISSSTMPVPGLHFLPR